MTENKKKKQAPSKEGASSDSQSKANRIKLGKGVNVGSKARLGEKY
tara:strand:- start:129 stop:266 length:138 start_codon:yes stop_codon:yes gene_type:complete